MKTSAGKVVLLVALLVLCVVLVVAVNLAVRELTVVPTDLHKDQHFTWSCLLKQAVSSIMWS